VTQQPHDRFCGIDVAKEPMIVYPTLHYQNGGIEYNALCETRIPGFYGAGEVTGGPAPFDARDRSRFLQALDQAVQIGRAHV
jgi:hypothetical protein